MPIKLDRRRFLSLGAAALGGIAGGSSLLRSLEAYADESVNKRRLLVLYADGGWTSPDVFMRPPGAPAAWTAYNQWRPSDSLVPDDTEWEFDLSDPGLQENDFSRVLRPLYRHRSKMTVMEGLGMLSTGLDPHGDAHAAAHLAVLSGAPAAFEDPTQGAKSHASEPSIDQRVHEHLALSEPHLQSLNFRHWANRGDGVRFHEFLNRSDGMGGAQRVAVQTNPQEAHQFLFGFGQPSVEPDAFALAQNDMLSMSLGQFDAMLPRLSSNDRIRLEAHREMLNKLKLDLATPLDCGAVPPPGSIDGMSRAEQMEADFDWFAELAVAALACGASRVASLAVSVPPEAYGLDASTSIHHEYEHETDPFGGFGQGTIFENVADALYTSRYEAMVARNVVQAEHVARVLDLLDSVPEEDGTLLDNTLVLYVSELSHGNHGHEHHPFMLFGGGAGAVTPGRYLKYPQNNPNPWNRNYRNEFTCTPHSHLLISIAQAFGIDLDHIAAPSVEGVVPHLNISGTVSLSGPLPRLV